MFKLAALPIPIFISLNPTVQDRLDDLQAVVECARANALELARVMHTQICALYAEQTGLLTDPDVAFDCCTPAIQMQVDRFTRELLVQFFKTPGGAVLINRTFDSIGGESAFQVSEEAGRYAAYLRSNGVSMPVTPLHLGDTKGLKTPESFIMAYVNALREGKTTYTPAPGIPEVRVALANYFNGLFGLNFEGCNVALSAAKSVLHKLIYILVDTGVGVAYPVPGYPMYESGTKAFDGVPHAYKFKPDGQLDIDSVQVALDAGAKVLVINDDHNPTGATMSAETVAALQALLNRPEYKDVKVVFDLAYYRMRFEGSESHIKPLLQDMIAQKRGMGVWTFSKEGAATGLRIGAVFMPDIAVVTDGPTRTVMDAFIKLIGNQESCPVAPAQHALADLLTRHMDEFNETIATNCQVLQARRDEVVSGLGQINALFGEDVIQFNRPEAGFYLYADITKLAKMLGFVDAQGAVDGEAFRREMLRETGVSVCSGRHFGDTESAYPDQRFVRFSFSGVEKEELGAGMARIQAWVAARREAIAYFADKRVMIVGSGDVGQTAATWVTGVAAETTLVSRYGADKFSQNGVVMAEPVRKEVHPNVVASAGNIQDPQDVIFVAGKRGDDAQTIAAIQHLVGPKTKIISLQNGVDAGAEFARAFPDNVVGQTAIFAQLTHNDQGQVVDRKQAKWVMGPALDTHSGADDQELLILTRHLKALGMQNASAEPYDAFRTTVAKKLINNLGNFGCLELAQQGNGLRYADLLADSPEAEKARNTLKVAIRELLTLFQVQGYGFVSAVDDATVNEYFKIVLRYVKTAHVSTTVNAYREGLPIEDLLSEVRSKSRGIATPVLDTYIEMASRHNAAPMRHPDLRPVVPEDQYDARLAVLVG